MLTEKMNAIFPLYHSIFFQPFPVFSLNVLITTELNGTIMITFSMHSVVSFCSPFTVSQMPQPPMTLDNGFIHKLRFNSVRNKIIEDKKQQKQLPKEHALFEFLIPCHYGALPSFTCCSRLICIQVENIARKERRSENPNGSYRAVRMFVRIFPSKSIVSFIVVYRSLNRSVLYTPFSSILLKLSFTAATSS